MSVPFTAFNYLSLFRIAYIVLLFNTAFRYSCLGQSPVFQHLDVRDGLAQNTVLSITQDARGFMWFCTPEGLNRYDSQTFRTYRSNPANPRSISSDWTICSFLDAHQTLWIGTYKGLNRYNPQSDSFQQFLHNPGRKSSLSDNYVGCMYEDSKGRIWIGTHNGLNRLVDAATNRFERYFFAGSKGINSIHSICEDQAGNLWVGTSDGLIKMVVDQGKIQYKTFKHTKDTPNSLSDNDILALARDHRNNIWIGTRSGELDRFDPSTDSFIHTFKVASLKTAFTQSEINCLFTDKTGDLWIGRVEGIVHLDPSSMKFTDYRNDPDNPKSLSDNSVYSIFQDNQGSVWVGTYYSGVNVLYPNNTPFETLKANKSSKGLNSKLVNCIAEDRQHDLWIGSDRDGLDYINRQTGLRKHYKAGPDHTKGLLSNQIKAIHIDKSGYIWVGTRDGGLGRLDPSNHQWTSYRHRPSAGASAKSDNIYALLEDDQQRFWVLTGEGIDLFDKKQGTFQRYELKVSKVLESTPGIFYSNTIHEDSHKNIWIGMQGGVYLLRYKRTRVDWLPFEKNTQNTNLLRNEVVNCFHEDRRGRLWVGTQYAGLKQFDAAHNKFINYTKANGFSQDVINAIQSDNEGILWLSTTQGLTRFDPETKRSHTYTSSDGIPGSEFESNASYRDHDGKLYFGSNDGLLYFDPYVVRINNQPPTVVFTDLEIANKPVEIGDESNLLINDICLSDQLTFNYQQNFFTINFAVLNYIKPKKNEYAYKLDGIDDQWHYTKTPSVTYSNLPSGTYMLLVKGANNDGIWSTKPAQIRLILLPPIWKTWWAYCLYSLASAVILYFILRFFWLRNTFAREQELHQAKLDFFTNISHEIRTHLTLIIGPIDVLLRIKPGDGDVRKQLTYAKNSSDSLLSLVTELMDFRKAEGKQLSLHISQNDIVAYIKNIIVSFQHLAEKRNTKISFSSNEDIIQLWFDTEQFAKVIYNLLSNAYKFISDGGEIHISAEDKGGFVDIKIYDNGKGISEENIKKLFKNYFQVYDYGVNNTGYGIGLALSQKITEAHQGTLLVESEEAQNGRNGFTCFTIRLRKGYHHFTEDQLVATTPPRMTPAFREFVPVITSETASEPGRSYTVLIVEDNTELRGFLRNVLTLQYHIIEAVNGQEGWEVAIESILDMIISDVMMADLDGLELCRRLKSDERTSHIPVILLTAKATIVNQVEGLETGADSYLIKPINMQLLELTIRNLFTTRELMRQKFGQQITTGPPSRNVNPVDERFIRKIIQFTEQHMGDPEFGVEMITIEVGMSTPVLYKKMKALTNMSVNDFTKSIRMKKAAQLLQQGHLTINEVAYEVGFDDRRYFSREFKKKFGQNPSEYAKRRSPVS